MLVVVRGSGVLVHEGGQSPITLGQVWLLPAGMAPVECRPGPGLAVLISTLPDPS